MFTRDLQIISSWTLVRTAGSTLGVKEAVNQRINSSGFTLIEMLVVIFVLWVGILSITVLITRNLSLVKNIHTQTTATILAREGIEMIYNVRDTNSLLWYEWNCAQRATQAEISTLKEWQEICQDYMRTWDSQSHRFVVEWWLGSQAQITLSWVDGNNFNTLFSNSKLYLTWITIPIELTWYTHIWNGDTTFARYIEFTWMNSLPISSPIKKSDIHHIKSVILYKLSNNSTGEIILESFITNKE
jgi:Tfp pilus assembly protein PilV